MALGAGLGVPVLLFWRHRYPYAVTLVAAAVAVVLPIGSWTALVALAGLVSRRRGEQVWWTAGAVTLATAVSVARDARGPDTASSLLKTVMGPASVGAEPVQVVLAWWVVPAAVALAMGVAVGAGLLVRASREAHAAAREASVERATTDRLGDQAARQQERERIAREVHDVLGHRLSLLNLHAGAVATRAAHDPEPGRERRFVRSMAARSMEDLRSLLAVLREPLGTTPAAPGCR